MDTKGEMKTEEAIKAIQDNWPPSNYTMLREALTLAISVLQKLQSGELVEVVRCKDCVEWRGIPYAYCRINEINECLRNKNSYCSSGVRREEAEAGK